MAVFAVALDYLSNSCYLIRLSLLTEIENLREVRSNWLLTLTSSGSSAPSHRLFHCCQGPWSTTQMCCPHVFTLKAWATEGHFSSL